MELYKISGADSVSYSAMQDRKIENEAPKQEAASPAAVENENIGTNFDQYA